MRPEPEVLISVCICTRDRPQYLRSCLGGLSAQTVSTSSFEIIVVDSASSPECAAQIRTMTAGIANARIVRLERPGLSAARNLAARTACGTYLAYIDDDAIPADDWVYSIERAIAEADRPPAVLGGRILPIWEAPLPAWWPTVLRGTLTIIEYEGRGEYRTSALPDEIAPFGANLIIDRAALLSVSGFNEKVGRDGNALLSDEDVQIAWRLQAEGQLAWYDSRVVVRHAIQENRLRPGWLLRRLYWQGVSGVLTQRLLGQERAIRRGIARRLLVAVCLLPAALTPAESTHLLPLRWRLAYSVGYLRAALWRR